jgi:hypothetical protein
MSEPIHEFVQLFVAHFGPQALSVARAQADRAAESQSAAAPTWTRIADRIAAMSAEDIEG